MALQIIQHPSPLFGYSQGTHGRNGHAIAGIVYHTMDGYWKYYVEIIAGKVTIRNSANYSLNRDGTIHQHVKDADASWCNGPMDAPDLSVPWIKACWEQKINPNLVTLTIECEGRSGEAWPAVQTASLIEWSKAKTVEHHLAPDRLHLVGHHQVYAPKVCPGPSFPWTKLMPALVVAQPAGIGHVLASPINQWEGVGSGLVTWGKAHPSLGLPARQLPEWHRWITGGDEEMLLLSADDHLTIARWRKWTGEIAYMTYQKVRP